MFDNLSEKFDRAFKLLKGQGKITEINVAETLKEVRKALLDADVNYKIAKEFTDKVKEKALGANVLTAVSPGQLLVKITHDELAILMGGERKEINLSGNPSIILIAGLQGSGKTTFSGKLANMLQNKQKKNVLLVAGDVYRPAAINQLKVLGEQIGVEVFADLESKDPVDIAKRAIASVNANPKIAKRNKSSFKFGFLETPIIKDAKIKPIPIPAPAKPNVDNPAPIFCAACNNIY